MCPSVVEHQAEMVHSFCSFVCLCELDAFQVRPMSCVFVFNNASNLVALTKSLGTHKCVVVSLLFFFFV